MSTRIWMMIVALGALLLIAAACTSPNPQPQALTPIPTLGPEQGVALTGALAASPAPQSGAAAAVQPGVGGVAGVGAATFLKNCSPCHGVRGEGVTAPALRNSSFVGSGDLAVYNTIALGRSGSPMQGWLQANGGPLAESDLNNVVAFLHTYQNVPALPRATPLPTEVPATPEPTAAATSAPAEPARPSNEGQPGKAASLTGDAAHGKPLFGQFCASCHGPSGFIGIPNPDSDDGRVPVLNPIDETMISTDPKVFATNIDLFLEHGSVPAGRSPEIAMPSFGDSKMLTDQQMADIIAFLMALNPAK